MNEYKGFLMSPDSRFPQNIRLAKAGKGGSIPNELDSLYTSRTEAMRSIDAYEVKPKRGKSNAKAVAVS